MSTTLIQGGSFTSTGVGVYIPLSGGANYFKVTNLTQWDANTNGNGFQYEWWLDQNAIDTAYEWLYQSTGAVTTTLADAGGFTYSPGYGIPVFPVQSGTAITAAGPAVAAATNTLQNGDRVRLTAVTAMLQISTMIATVSSVSSSHFTLAGLDASGFAAAATTFNFQKISAFEAVLPEYAIITNISNAIQGVVTLSTITNYKPGMKIRLNNTTAYGMGAIEGAEATILSVGAFTTFGTYTLTTDLNTTGAGTWTWPASAPSSSQIRFATIAPDGQKAYYDVISQTQYGYNVQQAPFQSAYPSPTIYLAPGANSPAGSTSDVIEWQAFRYA